MGNRSFLYLTGDFFLSESDTTFLLPAIEQTFGDGFVLMNVEGAPRFGKRPRSKAVPLALNESVFGFRSLGNCHFCLVNNHTSDFGMDAFAEMKSRFSDRALSSHDTDPDPRRRIGPLALMFFGDEREDCQCRELGFLRFDRSVLLRNGRYLEGTYVIVHGGLEYRQYPTPYQRELSRMAVDLGAKAVIFHHSHVTGACEKYKDSWIHYGLGNFYFSQIGGLHDPSKLDGSVLRICAHTGTIESSKVAWVRSDRANEPELRLSFAPLCASAELEQIDDYRSWYKKKYPMAGSLRPRQLFSSERLNRLQFALWHAIAAPLVALGFSKRLKALLSIVVNRS
jgi:hypothetical protein